MSKNLKYKIGAIVVVLLACTYYIIGIPKSKAELLANLRQNIRLGLDLRGGSHLVVQVQVQDAFKSEADTTIERLKEELTKQGVSFASMDRNDPQTLAEADTIEIIIKGVPLDKTAIVRQTAIDRFPQWVLTAINSTDYRLNLRTTEALTLRRDTVERAVQTIEKRINGLGLTESTVQQRGRADAESEIMIQMPGVDDPASES
jgi:preprotein translocase subunit SecD